MKHTNININSPYGPMKYYFEYHDVPDYCPDALSYVCGVGRVDFYDKNTNLKRVENEWILSEDVVGSTAYIPTDLRGEISYNISNLDVYFPRFSVETYENKIKYALTITTYIHGVEVYLGTYLIDRNNVIAANKIRRFANEEYYEFLRIPIIDPWYLIYDDSWKPWRQMVCGEPQIDEQHELNNTGSTLCLSIHPVRESESGVYQEIPDYHGGQNSINLSDEVTDYLSFKIQTNADVNDPTTTDFALTTNVVFNQSYHQDIEGFKQYLKETYLIDTYTMKMELVVQDDNDIFLYKMIDVDSPWYTFGREDLLFDNWDGWHEGMFVNVFFHVITNSEDDSDFIYLRSNQIPLTQSLFRYLVGVVPQQKIFLSAVDMNVYNINAVNKIQQNIIQVERPDDYKANIIKPIFFRTSKLASLVIHPVVTEQICINLDQYKSKVNSFILQVENTSFPEIGRNSSGVIFRIVGNKLPNQMATGTYYILDQDSELITTGQYTYEQ